jgi:hypothetical protein
MTALVGLADTKELTTTSPPISETLSITMTSTLPLEPLLPHDILSSILDLLPLQDCLALSSISHATRAAALNSCFSQVILDYQDQC